MMSQQSSGQGLSFVYLEAGPDVHETDLNDWYDNEHAPLRLTVPGFMTAIRYKAIDSQGPTWLTLYDLKTPEVANSEEYNALRALGSDNERTILSKLGGLSRRSYLHMGTFTHPDTKAEELPSKYVLLVGLEMMTPEGEDELNKWYNEEHMDLLSKVPGWKAGRKVAFATQRSIKNLKDRRFKLVEFNQRGALADMPVPKYLAIHEFANKEFASTPEFKHATSTEWRERIMKAARREARVFELHKELARAWQEQSLTIN